MKNKCTQSLKIIFTLLCLYTLPNVKAGILLVNSSSVGTGARLSSVSVSDWNTGYLDLQTALASALSGDQIWIKAGVYRPTQNSNNTSTGPSDRTNTFSIVSGVSIYGGFAGTETVLASRNALVNITRLSGDVNNDDVVTGSGSTLTFTNNGENVYHVLTSNNITAIAVVDGITISGGNANSSAGYLTIPNGHSNGGGMFVCGGGNRLTVRNCNFINNAASLTASGRGGAGIFVIMANGTQINNCVFKNGRARNGGAIMLMDVSLTINNCVMTGNSTTVSGGAAYVYDATPVFASTVFYGNHTAGNGGAVSNDNNGNSTFKNCVFSGCTARQGGAICNLVGSSSAANNCTFNGNMGLTATGYGACMFSSVDSDASILNSILYGNTTPANTTDAGTEELYSANTSSPVTIAYSIVRETFPIANVTDGGNNKHNDPLFVNAALHAGADNVWKTSDDGLALQPCSPAREAGTSSVALTTDFIDVARPQNANYDMGAYELHASILSPAITPASLSGILQNTNYNQVLSQTGLSGTPVWSIISGSLPTGLTFSPATNTISGVPTTAESTEFTVSVVSEGCTILKIYSLQVSDPLPVSLVYFNAIRNNDKQVSLTWQTTNELNSKSFIVEQSDDGEHFYNVNTISAAGNSHGPRNYQVMLDNVNAAYYRLKQIDFDGQTTTTEPVLVEKAEGTIQVFPNPVVDRIQLAGNAGNYSALLMHIGDGSRTTYSGSLSEIEAALSEELKVLSSGLYVVQFIGENNLVETQRFVKVGN